MAKRTKIIIVIGIALLIAVGGFFAVRHFMFPSTEGGNPTDLPYSELTQQIEEKDVSSSDLGSFNDAYGGDFVTARNDVAAKAEKDWNRDTLDKVYFLIEYHQKLQEPDPVANLLDKLAIAKDAGVNINNNALRRDDAYRESVRTWLAEIKKSNPGNSYYGSGDGQ